MWNTNNIHSFTQFSDLSNEMFTNKTSYCTSEKCCNVCCNVGHSNVFQFTRKLRIYFYLKDEIQHMWVGECIVQALFSISSFKVLLRVWYMLNTGSKYLYKNMSYILSPFPGKISLQC